MDWNNVDLSRGYERDQNFLDGYSFDMLLLEIHCNMKKENITEVNVRQHVEKVIRGKVEEAYSILDSNLANIIKQAKSEKA